MLIGCLQFTPEYGAPRRNVERMEDLLGGCGADLVVLPELATTGYLFADRDEALALAEPIPDGPSVRALVRFAADEGLYLCVGLAEREGERLYDSAALVGPDGLLLCYRKTHLFRDEFDIFTPGDRGFPVADLPGGEARVGLMVCFDWIFPEVARCLALEGAELILHPANLVLPHGQRAMETRAIENGVYTLTANRTGTEERAGKGPLSFTGGSRIHSPRGEVLASLGEKEEALALVEVDPALARDKHITERNSVIEDRRPALYRTLVGPGDPS